MAANFWRENSVTSGRPSNLAGFYALCQRMRLQEYKEYSYPLYSRTQTQARNSTSNWSKLTTQQECIPVECVPSAAVALLGGCLPGACLPRVVSTWGYLPRGVYGWGYLPRGCLSGRGGVWTEFFTHACENITFPQLLLRTLKTEPCSLFYVTPG